MPRAVAKSPIACEGTAIRKLMGGSVNLSATPAVLAGAAQTSDPHPQRGSADIKRLRLITCREAEQALKYVIPLSHDATVHVTSCLVPKSLNIIAQLK